MSKPSHIVWTIAGSDSGGGAGIQADMATVHDLGCHCACVITTITAQNSVSVDLVESVSAAMLLAQLNSLARDLPPAAIKIGLLASQQQLDVVANWLTRFKAAGRQGRSVAVILDPVMIATSGDRLNLDLKLDFSPFKGLLTLLTPNQQELAHLVSGLTQGLMPVIEITDDASFTHGAIMLAKAFDCHVLAKGGDGGHWQGQVATDCYVCHRVEAASELHDHACYLLTSPRVKTANNHGSGCTLSAAIASFMAQDFVLHDAIVLAKAYVTKGLMDSYQLGAGPGCLARTGWPNELDLFPQVRKVSAKPRNQDPLVGANIGFKTLAVDLGLYPVVDSALLVKALLEAGCRTVQLRLKGDRHSLIDIESQIVSAIDLGRRYQAQVFINDHWQLALRHGAFGIHLGQEDMADVDLGALRLADIALGVSSHSYFEILLAHSIRPSYIALGHIFPTPTKTMASRPQGLIKLAHYARLLKGHYPTVAIGGIDESSFAAIKATKVDNVALVRAVTQALDPKAAFVRLERHWRGEQYLAPDPVEANIMDTSCMGDTGEAYHNVQTV